MTGDGDTILVGTDVQLEAQLLDANGFRLTQHIEVQWFSSDPMIASVSDDGVVSALALGEVMIRAAAVGLTVELPFSAWNVTEETASARFVEVFASEFGVVLSTPAWVTNYRADQGLDLSQMGTDERALGRHRWTSVVWLPGTRPGLMRVLRIYLWPDGGFDARVLSDAAVRPAKALRQVNLFIDDGSLPLREAVSDSAFLAGQDEDTNGVARRISEILGQPEPIYWFEHTNLIVPASAFANAVPSGLEVEAYLEEEGLLRFEDWDVWTVFLPHLDSEDTGWRGIAMLGGPGSWSTCSLSFRCEPLTGETLRNQMVVLHLHELAHVFSWEHPWATGQQNSACDDNAGLTYFPCGTLQRSALFGWTDADGDGIIEILDPTPYGGVVVSHGPAVSFPSNTQGLLSCRDGRTCPR